MDEAQATNRWPEFPTPFTHGSYGEGVEPLLEKELELGRVSNAIRAKPNWWEKVHDTDIVEKWKGEVRGSTLDMSAATWEYLIDELKWRSGQIQGDGIRISPVDGVFECDTLVPRDLHTDLLEGVSKLEARASYCQPLRERFTRCL